VALLYILPRLASAVRARKVSGKDAIHCLRAAYPRANFTETINVPAHI
jgi:hypothetical protein